MCTCWRHPIPSPSSSARCILARTRRCAAWPTYDGFATIKLPRDAAFYINAFTKAYRSIKGGGAAGAAAATAAGDGASLSASSSSGSNKRLEWQYGLGTAEVTVNCDGGKTVGVSCTTLQMMVLLATNEPACIHEGTGIAGVR